jgi:hypothetical protein
MTWMGAFPILVIAGIFDLLRLFFEQFWFFGPALAAVYCTSKVSGVVGTTIGGLICTAGAGAVGYVGSGAIESFGVVMAMAVGLFGWMTVGLMLIMMNGRIFKENEYHSLWFAFSLLIGEVPIIGSFPALIVIIWKMYGTQIKKDEILMKKYWKETEEARLREQNQKIAEFQQTQNEEIPEDVRMAV